jgi:hypothetical protein
MIQPTNFVLTLEEQLTLRQALIQYREQNPDNTLIRGLVTKFDDIRANNKFQFYYL